MTGTQLQNADFLHDAEVYEIRLSVTEAGDRPLRIELRCNPDCGYDSWNDKNVCVMFGDPLLVYGDLFGHMANAETLGAWNNKATPRLLAGIKILTDAGLSFPKPTISLNFSCGSIIDVACDDLTIAVHV